MHKQQRSVPYANPARSLFGNDEYADLTIVCGPLTFRVHKAIVCPRSAYFRSACRKGYFKVGIATCTIKRAVIPRKLTASQEGEEDLITLKASSTDSQVDNTGTDDPEAITHLIYYLYNLDYKARFHPEVCCTIQPLIENQIKPSLADIDSNATSWDSPKVHDDDRSLCVHARVFAAAVEYGIHSLQALSHVYFKDLLSTAASGGVSFADIAATIPLVHTSTPANARQLRSTLATAILDRSLDLLQDPRIVAAIESVEGLALELLIRSSGNTPAVRVKPCTKCGRSDIRWECMWCQTKATCLCASSVCSECRSSLTYQAPQPSKNGGSSNSWS